MVPFSAPMCVLPMSNTISRQFGRGKKLRFFKAVSSHFILIFGNKQYFIVCPSFIYTYMLFF